MCLRYKSFENIVEKGEIARNEQFLVSHSVFYPFEELSAFFIKIWNCLLQTLSVWKSLKFAGWEMVNTFPHNDAFWRPWETSLLKTLWEKEKLLVTSNFSFSHSVFYPYG